MKKTVLITGGVGFIGANTALSFAQKNYQVMLLDNFSRSGVDTNYQILKSKIADIQLIKEDAQDTDQYLDQLKKADVIIHLAGQTAVTTSLADPQHDFTNNLQAGFNLLEAIRIHNPQAICLYASTNKVYGDLTTHTYKKDESSKRYLDTTSPDGVHTSEPLQFASPYGCSKGAIDQYFLDYAHSFDLKTVVFRQSCIYGPFQQGVEDQGWVAHFSRQALQHKPLTIFGDGFQVRDLLYIDDLVDAYHAAIEQIDTAAGNAYNIGGGIDNSASLLNIIEYLENELSISIELDFQPQRRGDQKVFISANQKIKQDLGWQSSTKLQAGLKHLIDWQQTHLDT